MDKTVVFKKTVQGENEIKTRSGHVSSAARRVLILVNGTSTVADLLESGLSNVEILLEELVAKDMIESGQHPARSAETAGAPGPSLKDALTELAKQTFTAELQAVIQKIEAAEPTPEGFEALFRDIIASAQDEIRFGYHMQELAIDQTEVNEFVRRGKALLAQSSK